MSFVIGCAAALIEICGSYKASQWVYKFAGNVGRRMDGYDAVHSLFGR